MTVNTIIGIILAICWLGIVGFWIYRELTNWFQHLLGKKLYKLRRAEFVENIYGDLIFYYNCRSIWKIPHWPFYVKSDDLYDESAEK